MCWVVTTCSTVDGAPNYHPNSFNGPCEVASALEHQLQLGDAKIARYDTLEDDNWSQPRAFWEKVSCTLCMHSKCALYLQVLGEQERKNLVANIAGHLCNAQKFLQVRKSCNCHKQIQVQERAVENFTHVHADFGAALRAALAEKNTQ